MECYNYCPRKHTKSLHTESFLSNFVSFHSSSIDYCSKLPKNIGKYRKSYLQATGVKNCKNLTKLGLENSHKRGQFFCFKWNETKTVVLETKSWRAKLAFHLSWCENLLLPSRRHFKNLVWSQPTSPEMDSLIYFLKTTMNLLDTI